MCTQSVGLVAGVLESRGIATSCIALLRGVAEKVRPPRALTVPFDFGCAMGPAGDGPAHERVLRAALMLLEEPGPPPVLRDWSD